MDLRVSPFQTLLRQRLAEYNHEIQWEKVAEFDLILRNYWSEFHSRLLGHLNSGKEEPQIQQCSQNPSSTVLPPVSVNVASEGIDTFSEKAKRIQITMVLGLFFVVFISLCFIASSVHWKYE